jgi:hypothetical protein
MLLSCKCDLSADGQAVLFSTEALQCSIQTVTESGVAHAHALLVFASAQFACFCRVVCEQCLCWFYVGCACCFQVDLDALRELSWSGIPQELRPVCWRLLLGYLPPNK